MSGAHRLAGGDIAPEAQPTDRALPRCLPSYSEMGSVFGRSAAGDSGVVSGAVAGLEDWVQSPLISFTRVGISLSA